MSLRAQIPPHLAAKSRGLAHLLASAGYSFAGFRRLLGEAAFRQEICLGAFLLALLLIVRAPLTAVFVQGILLLVLAATEALNTAVELIVDRLSPEFSSFAKDAKDLGSFAVACLLAVNVGHAILALAQFYGH